VDVAVPTSLGHALVQLGLATTMGYLRLAHLPGSSPTIAAVTMAVTEGGGLAAGRAAAAAIAELPSPQAAVTGGSGFDESAGAESAAPSLMTRISGGLAAAAGGSSSSSGLEKRPSVEAVSGAVGAPAAQRSVSAGWVPLTVAMGVPLYCLQMCKLVCARARDVGTLTASGREWQRQMQQQLCAELDALVAQFSAHGAHAAPLAASSSFNRSSMTGDRTSAAGNGGFGGSSSGVSDVFAPVQLPGANLLFDGTNLVRVDLTSCMQGAPAFL